MEETEIIKLQFQTPQEYTSFRKAMKGRLIKNDILNLIMECECNKQDVALALTFFGCKVIEPKK